MSRFIAFVFCIAFLFLAGGWVKSGMVLMAGFFALLATFVVYLFVKIFLGPPRQR